MALTRSKDAGGVETPTLFDVARLAGVSPSTVSRILNGTARVADEKRQAVEAAIQKLKFRPNLAARSLRSGSTRTIGVLTQELESPYFTRGTKGIEQGLIGTGYAPIVLPGHWDPDEELDRARLLIARKVDAMVILGGSLTDLQVAELARSQPIAITGRQSPPAHNVFSFYFDQEQGAFEATRHLIELGHRAIAHICGPAPYPDAAERREGYMRAHREHGLSIDPRLVVEGNYLETGGTTAMQRLLDGDAKFTAVFCANDQSLWGARLELFRRGIRVPEDLSLVGFDDLPQAAYMTPPVTTVRQPIFDMGWVAATTLLAELGVASVVVPTLPSVELVVRQSTAPPSDVHLMG